MGSGALANVAHYEVACLVTIGNEDSVGVVFVSAGDGEIIDGLIFFFLDDLQNMNGNRISSGDIFRR